MEDDKNESLYGDDVITQEEGLALREKERLDRIKASKKRNKKVSRSDKEWHKFMADDQVASNGKTVADEEYSNGYKDAIKLSDLTEKELKQFKKYRARPAEALLTKKSILTEKILDNKLSEYEHEKAQTKLKLIGLALADIQHFSQKKAIHKKKINEMLEDQDYPPYAITGGRGSTGFHFKNANQRSPELLYNGLIKKGFIPKQQSLSSFETALWNGKGTVEWNEEWTKLAVFIAKMSEDNISSRDYWKISQQIFRRNGVSTNNLKKLYDKAPFDAELDREFQDIIDAAFYNY
ncbi:hypothetical protein NX722_24305 [Endozoicomonas gorgoniicola]|uniref:Uncharacterized protein n=1 Tax=Endozoicomonas gorgoniicola TaxID=1234144 RepID=A0ABT3N238_9GAMM|nr:hypothetical protein [Endozoicomonas gorgoniicola]MCW7555693.1 hypothetical protein [Endozoicomonas gorgoniicola]